MSCGVGCRCGSDPMLLWLWCRPVAIAPIGPLAWEPPYVTEAALEMAERPKKKKSEVLLSREKPWLHYLGFVIVRFLKAHT